LFIERLENIKSQMSGKIYFLQETSDVIVLKFSRSDFYNKINWRDENEFELNGKMYDVIKIEKQSDEYTVFCFNDEKEELLISNFKKLIDINVEQKNCINVQHNSFVMLAIKNDNYLFKKYSTLNNQPIMVISNYSSKLFDISDPPPKVSI